MNSGPSFSVFFFFDFFLDDQHHHPSNLPQSRVSFLFFSVPHFTSNDNDFTSPSSSSFQLTVYFFTTFTLLVATRRTACLDIYPNSFLARAKKNDNACFGLCARFLSPFLSLTAVVATSDGFYFKLYNVIQTFFFIFHSRELTTTMILFLHSFSTLFLLRPPSVVSRQRQHIFSTLSLCFDLFPRSLSPSFTLKFKKSNFGDQNP